jgi:hypothetical protein
MIPDPTIVDYLEFRVRSCYRTSKFSEIEAQVLLHKKLPVDVSLRLLLLKEYGKLTPLFFERFDLKVILYRPIDLKIPNKLHLERCATQSLEWLTAIPSHLPKGLVTQVPSGVKLLDGYHRTSQLNPVDVYPYLQINII